MTNSVKHSDAAFQATTATLAPSTEQLFTVALFKNLYSTTPDIQELTWSQIGDLLKTHRIRNVKDGQLISFAEYKPDTTRANINVNALTAGGFDVDDGLTLAAIKARLKKYLPGVAAIIYSTYSHTEDIPRWRVVIPFSQPLPATHWRKVQPILAKKIGGNFTDESCIDEARALYLPACPLSGKDAATAETIDGEFLDLSDILAEVEAAAAPKSSAQRHDLNDQTSVIDAYNAAHTIQEVLERHGYTRKGARYAKPGGARKSVTILDGLSYHFSPNDPLRNGHRRDPFDVYLHYEHKGNVREAVKAAARELGIERDPAPPAPIHAITDPLPASERITLAQVVSIVKGRLYLPDPEALYVLLGTIAANELSQRIGGDPTWTMLIAPPGGCKTELIRTCIDIPQFRLAGDLSVAALLSGTPKRDKDKSSTGGLLREIGPAGIIGIKDFTTILSMKYEKLFELLAALREIFDGHYVRNVGVDGGKTLEWKGKLGIIAGCTEAIETHHAVMNEMGERFIYYRLPEMEKPQDLARQALSNIGQEDQLRSELAKAVTGLFASIDWPSAFPSASETENDLIIGLALLVAQCRGAVPRDRYTREITEVYGAEAPTRLTKQLACILAGMRVIGVPDADAWKATVKIGLDSVPKSRRRVFGMLSKDVSALSTSAIGTGCGYPTTVAKRALEDLAAHDVITRESQGQGKADLWSLVPEIRESYSKIRDYVNKKETPNPQTPLYRDTIPGTQIDADIPLRGESGLGYKNGAPRVQGVI